MGAVAKPGGALHGLLFLAAVGTVSAAFAPLPWPWHLLLPLLVYAAIALAVPRLRRTAPRLALGRMGGAHLAFAVVLALATSGVLVGYHAFARPDVTDLAAHLPVAAFGNLVVASVCFSVANAAIEELVFRGVVWAVVASEWNNAVALVVTALLFGLGHLQGYPPGPLGAGLAALYGVALGLLRWGSGGVGRAGGVPGWG